MVPCNDLPVAFGGAIVNRLDAQRTLIVKSRRRLGGLLPRALRESRALGNNQSLRNGMSPLQNRRWTPLRQDFLDPDIPSSEVRADSRMLHVVALYIPANLVEKMKSNIAEKMKHISRPDKPAISQTQSLRTDNRLIQHVLAL